MMGCALMAGVGMGAWRMAGAEMRCAGIGWQEVGGAMMGDDLLAALI